MHVLMRNVLTVHFIFLPSDTLELQPEESKMSENFKVGLGISRTNADSQWNPVYNAFHQ